MRGVKKTIGLMLVLAVIFLFGWESASYYILKKTAEEREVTQEDVSPMAAFSSLIGSSDYKTDKADLTTFWTVWSLLEETYVDETVLDRQQMAYGAIKGMVAALNDPYTVYMTPQETIEFDQNLNGQLEGIGAELTVREQMLVVVTPLKNSPAESAGLKSGDIVYKIDGGLTAEMTLFEAIMKIRGEKGTRVTLTIIREGVDEPFEIPIVRDTVNIESASFEEIEDGIFLINIYQFNDNTTPEFLDAVKQIAEENPDGVILDLRNNGGGYLEISVDILSEFLEGTMEAVTIKRRDDSENETLYVTGDPLLPDVPLAVLINEGSASAAEIVAGAIQDYQRGIIIGETSFGKGSVQEVDKLGDGSSIRLTIAKWYTPNGNNIDYVGITPDMEIEFVYGEPVVDEEDGEEDDESADGDSEDTYVPPIDEISDNQLDAATKYLREL